MKIKPMLAYTIAAKEIDWSKKVYAQPKLDGVRCLLTKDGGYSRTGKKFKNITHIELAFVNFFKNNPDAVLDGELYNHKLKDDFEKIISLVRKQKPTADDKLNAQHLVQYHIYDMVSEDRYTKRYNRLQSLKEMEIDPKVFDIVDTYIVDGLETCKTAHGKNLARGYEGTIVRVDAPYEQKRSYTLRKWKDFSDAEATITGYEEGKGKRQGTLGKFLMTDDEGIEFGCPPGKGYSYKDLSNMLLNIHDYIGQRATFTYFERTKANSYRHPLFKCLRNYE